MSRDLSVAWELLTAVTRARQQLATARPLIWEKARLPTAEHTSIVRASADGNRWSQPSDGTDPVVIRVSVAAHLPDGRRVSSCLDIVAGPNRWRTQPYIVLIGGDEQLLWEGQTTDRDDSSVFSDDVDSAARGLLMATIGLDFASLAAR